MQETRLTGSIGFSFLISDELGSTSGGTDDKRLFDCGLPPPSLRKLLPGQEVPCGICDIPWMIS